MEGLWWEINGTMLLTEKDLGRTVVSVLWLRKEFPTGWTITIKNVCTFRSPRRAVEPRWRKCHLGPWVPAAWTSEKVSLR